MLATGKGITNRHTGQMAEAKVLDEVRAVSAFALTSGKQRVMDVWETIWERCSPAPGPPRTKMTVTLLWSNTGFGVDVL